MLIRKLYALSYFYIGWILFLGCSTVNADGRNTRRRIGNECAKGTLQCHPDADCIDSVRASRCKCKKGFYGDGRKCVDKDECEYKNGGCVHFCHNIKGNYTCACKSGFQLDIGNKDCIDINECFRDKGGCEHQCVNTMGGYECRCNKGYSLEQDGNRCKLGESWCQKRQGCEHSCRTSQQNTVVCTCRDGYRLHSNGKNCIRSCRVGNGGCQHNCSDTPVGVQCGCAVDYLLTTDKSTCTATCMVNNGGCAKKCKDDTNGPVCSCPLGFELHQNQKSCLDIDECVVNNGGCSNECVNFEGGYECVCAPGYKVQKDQKTCQDVDECDMETTCDHICINTPGSYLCACNTGYDRYGLSHCADRDECSNNNGGCEHSCDNSIGDFTCVCRDGYKLHKNGKDCIGESTCSELSTPPAGILTCKVEGGDKLCAVRCDGRDRFTIDSDISEFTTHCGPGTQYKWDHDTKIGLPSCSSLIASPNLSKKVRFSFIAKICKKRKSIRLQLSQNITGILNDQKMYKCHDDCRVDAAVSLKCDRIRPQRGRGQLITFVVTAEFDLTYKALDKLKKNCDVRCEMKKTERRLKKVVKKLRKVIRKNDFIFSYAGSTYTADKKKFKSPRGTTQYCNKNWMLLENMCVGCSKGTYYDKKLEICRLCPPSYFQDEEAQSTCKSCPTNPPEEGIHGAASEEDCTVECEPGQYSQTGLKPCLPCPKGTYQPEYGRLSCQRCAGGLDTSSTGSLNFNQCLSKEEPVVTVEKPPRTVRTRYVTKTLERQSESDSEDSQLPSSDDTYKPYVIPQRRDLSVPDPERDLQTYRRVDNSTAQVDANRPSAVESVWSTTPNVPSQDSRRGHSDASRNNVSTEAAVGATSINTSAQPTPAMERIIKVLRRADAVGRNVSEIRSDTSRNVSRREVGQLSTPNVSHKSVADRNTVPAVERSSTPDVCRNAVPAVERKVTPGPAQQTRPARCRKPPDRYAICEAGYHYDVTKSVCAACPRGLYQSKSGQDFCIKCPMDTTTDTEASTTIARCKSHQCGEVFSKRAFKGIIQSPNYPGDYPVNVTCVWKIRPAKDRRILVIIPEVNLPKTDKCGDKLVMRKSKNEFSTVTYETCETEDRPIAFTARSKKMWIQFQSDGMNTGKGFSIPFVTYNPDYERLIESIVEDGKLYESYRHQSVLKDRKLLLALMEVIAKPQIYFQYANVTNTIMPPSFIKLLTKKVIRFFRP